ncbi:MAG: B12-binding domain-containing radical SAM protein [Leucothrix sp.]
MSHNVLIVDLNNFARYPTLAIGYLVAPLRAAGFNVNVLSPLAHGAPPMTHEREETRKENWLRKVNFSTHPVMQRLHEPLRKVYTRQENKPHAHTLKAVEEALQRRKPDIILLSAYLNHYPAVKALGEMAKAANVPIILGGPAFSNEKTIKEWQHLEGINLIFAGEADVIVPTLVKQTIAGTINKQWPGVCVPSSDDNSSIHIAPPFANLDRLPVPDFDDFPWDAYPHRIIPIMTGRGCSWNVCTFCSDVVTANGRTFRSRSLDSVLNELKVQSERYDSKDFIFLDLKINSNLEVWYGLIENFQKIVPGGRWIATVHVDATGENGLELEHLQAAKAAGLTRISFGFESGSEKLLKRMGKGTRMDRNRQFIEDAHTAGLSVRCSMMMGYPGETSDDLSLTAEFLDTYRVQLDRIRPARFKAIPGTRFEKLYHKRPGRFKGLEDMQWDYAQARASYNYTPAAEKTYRQEKARVLKLIHNINRQPLRDDAIQFDGLM